MTGLFDSTVVADTPPPDADLGEPMPGDEGAEELGYAELAEHRAFTLRPYQQQAVDAVYRHWAGFTDGEGCAVAPVRSTLLVLPTGTGKTAVASAIIQRRAGGRVMFIAHRQELIFQAKQTIERHIGEIAEVEMADYWAGGGDIVIATVQTLSRRRIAAFKPEDFSLLVVDECFPAGTVIDGRGIERYRAGDKVYSANHQTGEIETRTILRTFCRKPKALVRISLTSGASFVCTPEHPIFTLRGYVQACRLLSCDMVLTTTGLERIRNGYMRRVRDGREAEAEAVRSGGVQVRTVAENNPGELRQARGPDYEISQDERNARPSRASAGIDQAPRDGLGADSTGRQRNIDTSTAASSIRLGMGDGGCDSDIEAEGFRLSGVLQGGRWQQGFEDRHRSGWELSQRPGQTGAGPQERDALEFPWVDGVEILEPGRDGTFGGMCPDGFVYNLEVEGNNNYFANGILVHNCHHACVRTYKAIQEYFAPNPNLKMLGLTATPDRADEEALGKVFDSVAFDYELPDAVNDGWLVPICARPVRVKGLDLSSIRTTAGDLNGADLAAVLEEEEILHGFATPIIDLCAGRKSLIFTATVRQAERLSEILNRHQADTARWVCGKTPDEERKAILGDYRAGKYPYLVNVGVLTEGFDEPSIEVIVMGRPTKSRCLYAQCIGRGTRALPGVVDGPATPEGRKAAIAASAKKFLEVIDFTGNSGRHRLVTVGDLLGGRYDDDVIDRAQQKAEKANAPLNMTEALAEAQREIDEQKKRDAARRAALKVRADYIVGGTIDPFAMFGITKYRERGWEKGREPSEKMRACLERNGLWKDGTTFSTARQLIQGMCQRREKKLCTFRQAKTLAKAGLPTEVSFEAAHKIIDVLAVNRWRWPQGMELPK